MYTKNQEEHFVHNETIRLLFNKKKIKKSRDKNEN